MICPGNDRLWRKFAEALGHPEWPDEARFKTNVERMQQRDLLLGMIADIMRDRSRDYWSGKLDALGVPNGPLNTVPQVLDLAQVAALGMFASPALPARMPCSTACRSASTVSEPAAHKRRPRSAKTTGRSNRRSSGSIHVRVLWECGRGSGR
jgi:crotonobetainyl-CoA:carnitine CoA-transferase CaiB-like acyl-CoA transferase